MAGEAFPQQSFTETENTGLRPLFYIRGRSRRLGISLFSFGRAFLALYQSEYCRICAPAVAEARRIFEKFGMDCPNRVGKAERCSRKRASEGEDNQKIDHSDPLFREFRTVPVGGTNLFPGSEKKNRFVKMCVRQVLGIRERVLGRPSVRNHGPIFRTQVCAVTCFPLLFCYRKYIIRGEND